MNSGKVFSFLVLGVAIAILVVALPIGASHGETDMSAVDAKLGEYIHNVTPMSAVDAKLGEFIIGHEAPQMTAVDAKLSQFIVEGEAAADQAFDSQTMSDYFLRH